MVSPSWGILISVAIVYASSQQDVHGMLQQIPDCHLEFGRHRAVQQSVVEGEGRSAAPDAWRWCRRPPSPAHPPVQLTPRMAGVRLVDDGVKLSTPNMPRLDTVKVEPLYSSAPSAGWLGPGGQILALADRASRLRQVGVPDHGDDEPRVQSHRHAQIHMGPADDLPPSRLTRISG